MPRARRVGSDAEDRVATFLIEKGYTILTRRHKTRSGELDIVALDGEELVIVEVKSTIRAEFEPEVLLTPIKLARLKIAMAEYAASYELEARRGRIDLVAVAPEEMRHYEDLN